MVERELPDKAIELYLRVCDVGEVSESYKSLNIAFTLLTSIDIKWHINLYYYIVD